MKLSVVVPTYNSRGTLTELIESIIAARTDFLGEIIVADDGSEDGTHEAVAALSERHDQVPIKYVRCEHANAGNARNEGMRQARWDYLWFVDSDDLVLPGSIRVLEQAVEEAKEPPDMVYFKYRLYDYRTKSYTPITEEISSLYASVMGEVDTPQKLSRLLLIFGFPWNKIVRRELVEEHGIRFSSSIVHNDTKFSYLCPLAAKSIRVIGDELYVHVINNSASLTNQGDARRLAALEVFSDITEELGLSSAGYDDIVLRNIILNIFILIVWNYQKCGPETAAAVAVYLRKYFDSFPVQMRYFLLENTKKKRYRREILEKLNITVDPSEPIFDDHPAISLIVTVYNLEKFAVQTLESIYADSFGEHNFEVIVLDDLSTDNTVQKVEEFAKGRSNLVLYKSPVHTPGGVGPLANTGISMAKGEYIAFVDGDDFIKEGYLQSLTGKMIAEDCDVLIFTAERMTPDGRTFTDEYNNSKMRRFFDPAEGLGMQGLKEQLVVMDPVPWKKIYRTSFLRVNNIKFPEEKWFFEDNPFHWEVITKASSIAHTDDVLYVHRVGFPGATTTGSGDKYMAFTVHARIIYEYLTANNLFEAYRLSFLRWLFNNTNIVLERIGKSRKDYLEGIDFYLKLYGVSDVARIVVKFEALYVDFFIYYCYLRKSLACLPAFRKVKACWIRIKRTCRKYKTRFLQRDSLDRF